MSVFLSVGVLVLRRINMQHCWGFLTIQQSVLQHNLSDFLFFFDQTFLFSGDMYF